MEPQITDFKTFLNGLGGTIDKTLEAIRPRAGNDELSDASDAVSKGTFPIGSKSELAETNKEITIKPVDMNLIGKSTEDLLHILKARKQSQEETFDCYTVILIDTFIILRKKDSNFNCSEKNLMDTFARGLYPEEVSVAALKHMKENPNETFLDLRRYCFKCLGLQPDIVEEYMQGKLLDLKNPPTEDLELYMYWTKVRDLVQALCVELGLSMLGF